MRNIKLWRGISEQNQNTSNGVIHDLKVKKHTWQKKIRMMNKIMAL